MRPDYAAFCRQAREYYQKRAKALTEGQAITSHLTLVDQDLARRVPREVDPYHDDSKLPRFMEWLEENWDS